MTEDILQAFRIHKTLTSNQLKEMFGENVSYELAKLTDYIVIDQLSKNSIWKLR